MKKERKKWMKIFIPHFSSLLCNNFFILKIFTCYDSLTSGTDRVWLMCYQFYEAVMLTLENLQLNGTFKLLSNFLLIIERQFYEARGENAVLSSCSMTRIIFYILSLIFVLYVLLADWWAQTSFCWVGHDKFCWFTRPNKSFWTSHWQTINSDRFSAITMGFSIK